MSAPTRFASGLCEPPSPMIRFGLERLWPRSAAMLRMKCGDNNIAATDVHHHTQLRQKQHFVDVDSRAHDVLQYSMGTTGDRLSSVPLRSFPGLTPTSAAAAAEEAGSAFETYSGCATKGVGSPCVDLVFAWAPQFRDQVGACVCVCVWV